MIITQANAAARAATALPRPTARPNALAGGQMEIGVEDDRAVTFLRLK
jgi:hypothetical protein